MTAKRRICLFGTSANPPHVGHSGIIKFLSSLKDTADNKTSHFDEVRVLPVYKHMFREKRDNQGTYEDRLAMCHLAFDHIPNVLVSDDERTCFNWVAEKSKVTTAEDKSTLRVGTADLLDMLLEHNSSTEYTLALGADTFMDLSRWKWRRAKDIFELLSGRMIVIRRSHFQHSTNEGDTTSGKYSDQRIHNINTDISMENSSEAVSERDLTQRIHDISIELSRTCPNLKDYVQVVRIPFLSSYSSSLIRSSREEEVLSEALDKNVLNHIKNNKMYAFHQEH